MKRNQPQPEAQKKQKLQQMFKKIQNITIQLIQYLNRLYQQNNLTYCANQYYSTLIRLFSPFQLLNVYKIDKNMLYKSNYHANINYQHNENQHGITNLNIFNDKKIPNYIFPRSSYQLNTQQQKQIYPDNRRGKINHQQPQMQNYRYRLPQDIYNQLSISQQNTKKDQQNNKNSYRKGRPRILTQQQEIKLCNWIRQYTSKGKQITRFTIAQKAKQVASYQEFQASQSWLDRFLKRYSDIKGMIKIPNNMKNLKNPLTSPVKIEAKKYTPKETNVKKKIERKIKQKVKKQIQYSQSPKFYQQAFQSLEDYQKNLIFQQIVSDNQKNKEKEQQQQENSPIQDQNQSKNSKKSIQNQQKQQKNMENTKKQHKDSQKSQNNEKSKKLTQYLHKIKNIKTS